MCERHCTSLEHSDFRNYLLSNVLDWYKCLAGLFFEVVGCRYHMLRAGDELSAPVSNVSPSVAAHSPVGFNE